MLYGFKMYAILGKPYIVVRIPAHRRQFSACASHADRSAGGSHIEEP